MGNISGTTRANPINEVSFERIHQPLVVGEKENDIGNTPSRKMKQTCKFYKGNSFCNNKLTYNLNHNLHRICYIQRKR